MHRIETRIETSINFETSRIQRVGDQIRKYITVIIARIPKINDSQRCSGKIFVEDNGDRRRYSGAMTGMSRFLPPHVRRETDGAITRISNASQKRVPEQTPIRLTRIALALLFFQFQHTPTSLRYGDQRVLGFLASGRLPSSSFVFHLWRRFIRRACHARTCMRAAACCYTLRQCYTGFPMNLCNDRVLNIVAFNLQCCFSLIRRCRMSLRKWSHIQMNIRGPTTVRLARTGWFVINVPVCHDVKKVHLGK